MTACRKDGPVVQVVHVETGLHAPCGPVQLYCNSTVLCIQPMHPCCHAQTHGYYPINFLPVSGAPVLLILKDGWAVCTDHAVMYSLIIGWQIKLVIINKWG